MTELARCWKCGHRGPPEEAASELFICERCGEPLADGGDALFATRRYRLRKRSRLGLGLPAHILDEGDRELARVRRARPGVRRFFALLLGALVLSGGLLGLYALSAFVLGPWLVFLGAPAGLFAALRVTAWLSPAPELLVIQSGRDPRLLFRLRAASERGARTTLVVEDSNGTGIGELEIDRMRVRASAFAGLGGYLAIRSKDGVALQARRVSRVRPGAVYEDALGEPVATLGVGGGMRWDELALADPVPVDPRLLLAASLVAAP